MSLCINFEGLLHSTASWAKVNRKLLAEFSSLNGVDLAVQPRRGFQWDRDFNLPESLGSRPERFDDPDAKLTFPFPPEMKRDKEPGVPLVVHSLYEASRLPESWVGPLKSIPDLILVPSEHVKRIYRNEGIPASKLDVIPYGYDPEVFHPDTGAGNSGSRVRLLSVATPHFRKGLDLLKGVSDLCRKRNVTWRVHFPFTVSGSGRDFWVDPWIQDDLRDLGFDVTVDTLDEQSLADRYRESDLCVQPSRSEGFGLVILEAMASGTPVLTTPWGGQRSFRGPGMIEIPGCTSKAGRSQYHERRNGARVFEPDPTGFRSLVRDLVDEPDELLELGAEARETVVDRTWENSAKTLKDVLVERFSGAT